MRRLLRVAPQALKLCHNGALACHISQLPEFLHPGQGSKHMPDCILLHLPICCYLSLQYEGQRFVKYTYWRCGETHISWPGHLMPTGVQGPSHFHDWCPFLEHRAWCAVPTQLFMCPMQLEQREWQEDTLTALWRTLRREHGRQPLYTICFY